jgi:signal transduction histidine kinase
MTTLVQEENRIFSLMQTAFPDLSANHIAELIKAAKERNYPENFEICREGEDGSTMFILDSGEVDIIVHADNNQEILVDTLGHGAYFGEMAFLGETTRMATVRTRSKCHVLEIGQDSFMSIARTNPSLLRTLIRQIIGHIRRTDRAVINELNDKNDQLKSAFADLEEQEQLRTQFIVTLSHELRTPLTSIRGYLGLINQGAMKGASLEVALDSITRNVEVMVGHTNDLLFLYEMHPKAPQFEYLSVPDVLIEALNSARETMQDEATAVTLDINSQIPTIYADRQGLVLAVRALIENAFKYSPDNKTINIRTYHKDNHICIAVEDQGIGIAPENIDMLFEAFYRVEKEGGPQLFPGLGIGLTIAQFMVNRHQGTIRVESELGKGSTFTICLPAKMNNG